MIILSVALVVGAFILGMSEGDCTAAVILALLFLAVNYDEKKVKRNAKSK